MYLNTMPRRECTVSSRVTTADRLMIEAAVASRSTTVSAYVAEAVVAAARRDMIAAKEEGEDSS